MTEPDAKGVRIRVRPADRERLSMRFGPAARAWCDRLPELVAEFTERWRLDVLAAGGGGTSRVFRCRRRDGGGCAWLKLTPEPPIARQEAEALRAWAGTPSVVRLLAADPAAGALLLEDVRPGLPLRQADWGLTEVAELLRELRAAGAPASPSARASASSSAGAPAPGRAGASPALRPLVDRVEFLFGLAERRLSSDGLAGASGGPGMPGMPGMPGKPGGPGGSRAGAEVGPAVLDRARAVALELAGGGGAERAALVHGDLHPGNVLTGSGGRLVAIDPRPSWGDPDFDTVDWALDGAVDLAGLEARIGRLAELVPGLDAARVLGWCRALAVFNALPRVRARRADPHTRFLVALASGAAVQEGRRGR